MLTVVTPAALRRLTTVEHVRNDLGLTEGDADDTKVERLIDQATAVAERFCRRAFAIETVRETIRGCAIDHVMRLERAPAFAVRSVALNGGTVDALEYELDGVSLYRLSASGSRFAWRGSMLVVEYDAGFVLPGDEPVAGAQDLPADVELAAIRLVGAIFSASSRDQLIKSEDVDGVSSVPYWVPGTKSSLASPEAEALLKPYRTVRIR